MSFRIENVVTPRAAHKLFPEGAKDTPFILYLPDVALEKIFSYLSFDEIAKNRIVCNRFNVVGGRMLSRGFLRVEKRHGVIYKRVKSLLPRRESERKGHAFSRHCDILQGVETRMNMLNMTYLKYIDQDLLCFIPGKVLDEIINVLNLVESDFAPPRAPQLLVELRDLSSMAMEHFDEHILPGIKERKERLEESQRGVSEFHPLNFLPPSLVRHPTQPFLVQQTSDFRKIKQKCKSYKHHLYRLSKNSQQIVHKVTKQSTRIKALTLKIHEQERLIQDQAVKILEQETALADFRKHLEEWDQKYKDLTAELVRAREDILHQATTSSYKSATATHVPMCYRSCIRPRKAQILPNISWKQDLERKRKSNILPDLQVKISRTQDSNNNVENAVGELRDLLNVKEKPDRSKSNLSVLIEQLIKTPLTSIKSRKRKMTEDIDLK